MLQKLNERIQGAVAWVVIVLIAITFVLFGVDYYMQSHQASDVEVTVNGEPISKQAFELQYRRAKHALDSEDSSANREQNIKKKVLDDLISNKLAVQAAKQSGFFVAGQQAKQAVLHIPQFQEDGHFSLARYQQALSGAMFTPETFQQEVQQGMLLNQQRFAYMGSEFALPSEVDHYVNLFMQTRDYQYMLVPKSGFKNSVQLDDMALQSYFDAHKSDYVLPEQVKLQFLELSLSKVKQSIRIDEGAAQAYYQENPESFMVPAQWHVAHILLPLETPESSDKSGQEFANDLAKELQKNPKLFDEYVKQYSLDQLSAANQGELPWIVAGTTPYDKVLSKLEQVGDVSKPLKTEQGFEIFRLIEQKHSRLKPFVEVQKDIQKQLVREQVEAKYAEMSERLADLSYQTPDTLEPVAKDLGLQLQETGWISRRIGDNQDASDIGNNAAVRQAAFSHDVLDLANNSEPIQLDDDKVIVIRVLKHQERKQQALGAVKDKVRQQLLVEKEKEAARALGIAIIAQQENPKALDSLIKPHALNWVTVQKAERDTDSPDADINRFAFGLRLDGKIQGSQLQNGDFVLVKLVAVHPGKVKELDSEQRTGLIQQIEASYGVMDYDLFINQLLLNAKIEKNA